MEIFEARERKSKLRVLALPVSISSGQSVLLFDCKKPVALCELHMVTLMKGISSKKSCQHQRHAGVLSAHQDCSKLDVSLCC